MEEREDQETPGDSTYSLFAVTGNQRCDPILREVCINQVPLKMELDIGAAVSVITQRTYQKIAQQNHIQPLQHSDLKLKSYTVVKPYLCWGKYLWWSDTDSKNVSCLCML